MFKSKKKINKKVNNKNNKNNKTNKNNKKKIKFFKGGFKTKKNNEKIKSEKNIKKNNEKIKINCANGKEKSYTCFSEDSLFKLKNLWNKRHPDSLIRTNDPKIIWSELKSKMYNVCNNEKCWLRQKFVSNNLDSSLLNYTFAPDSPEKWNKNPNEWLTSLDIENVMKQQEYYNKDFLFIGPSPINFDFQQLYGECIWNELCRFNLLDHIKNGKNKIGVIFNTDPHYLSGSHWISLFINIPEEYIFFFDSNGDETPKEVQTLINRIYQQGQSLNINFKVIENKVEHQKKKY